MTLPLMVTYDQLRERLGSRPFLPFRIVLTTGESIDVVRIAQAVAMKRRIIVGMPDDHTRWIWLDQLDRIEPAAPQPLAPPRITLRDELQYQAAADPFEPFLIKLVNGDSHEIRDPQDLSIGTGTATITTADKRWTVFPLDKINSLESLSPPTPPPPP
jgi:hypothetical protein